LRRKIYNLAFLPEARIVEVIIDSCGLFQISIHSSTPTPSILQVNKETRAEGVKLYKELFSHAIGPHHSSVWYRLELDTLFFSHEKSLSARPFHRIRGISPEDMDEVQFLKLDIMSWAEGHRFWRSVQGFESDFDLPLRYFRGLKVFNLVDRSSSEYDIHNEGLAMILLQDTLHRYYKEQQKIHTEFKIPTVLCKLHS
jgi:hypothetical protein